MPTILFQIALALILLHAVYQSVVSIQNGLQEWKNWGELIYRLSIAVAGLSFFLNTLP